MITTILYLDTRKKYAVSPVKIRLTKDRKAAFIPTGISIPADCWDSHTRTVIRLPEAEMYNTTLQYKLTQVKMKLLLEEPQGTYSQMQITEIRDALFVYLGLKKEEDVAAKTFFVPYLKKVAETKKPSTKSIYYHTLQRIESYCKNSDKLRFDDITPQWLHDFDNWLAASSSVNTRNIHFRNIRAVFNRAIDDEVITYYPFRKFKHRAEETRKRALSVEELRTLWNYPCEPHLVKYIDLFKLVFYLRGINLADLFYLKRDDYHGGRIEYRRAKTGRFYSVKVEPEAAELIEKYRGQKYLLNWGDRYKEHKSLTHRANKELKTVGKVERRGRGGKKFFTPLFPHISIYAARHSVATLMADLDIPNETIAATLGHSYGNSTTAIYIKPNQNKVDKAMRQIIDYVLNEERA